MEAESAYEAVEEVRNMAGLNVIAISAALLGAVGGDLFTLFKG